jgi:hypothetical protein
MSSDQTPSCPNCKVALRGLGQLPIRVGGVKAGWHFFLGELADLSETIKPLDVYRCEQCGRLEFYDHDFSLPER